MARFVNIRYVIEKMANGQPRKRAKLKDLWLKEFSAVRNPAQTPALIEVVKSEDDGLERGVIASVEKAPLSAEQRDALPASAFLYVAPDGTRHFPYRNHDGSINEEHLRLAAQMASGATSVPPDVRARVKARAESLLGHHDTAKKALESLKDMMDDDGSDGSRDSGTDVRKPTSIRCSACGSYTRKSDVYCSACGGRIQSPPSTIVPPENLKMDELTQLKAKHEDLKKELATAMKIADLSDAEKIYYNRLPVAKQAGFLDLGAADRQAKMKPVFTSKSGVNFYDVDDPRVIDMAKSADVDRETLGKQLESAKLAVYKAQAETELAHLPGTVEERATLLQAIDSVQGVVKTVEKAADGTEKTVETPIKERLLEIVKSGDKKVAPLFQRGQGVGAPRKTPSGNGQDPEAQLEALVNKMVEKDEDGLTVEKAWEKVLDTKEGARLYGEMEEAKKQKRLAAQGIVS